VVKISNSFSGLPVLDLPPPTGTASGPMEQLDSTRATSPEEACVSQILPRGDTCLHNYGPAQKTDVQCRDATFQRRRVKCEANGCRPRHDGKVQKLSEESRGMHATMTPGISAKSVGNELKL
jgi:hypothetical protein